MGVVRPYFFAMTTRKITACGVLAAVYTALTLLMTPWSFGAVQFRISEALCVLCYLDPALIPGLALGCLLSNCFSTVSALDLLFGTAATLLGCLTASRIRRKWLFPLPIVLFNAVLIGIELSLTLSPDAALRGILVFGGQVALGEAGVLYLLGLPLLCLIENRGKEKFLKLLNGSDLREKKGD